MGEDPLAVAEREKYERVWAHDAYRRYSPGASLVDTAIKRLGMRPGDTMIDFGCGTGRPAMRFMDRGLAAIGIDHTSAALDAEARRTIRFEQACLWNLPTDLRADWGFCTDVMEHIPPERVHDVLLGIAERTAKGVFFQIALTRDGFGPQIIGAPLHLTIRSASWWFERLWRHWPAVEVDDRETTAIFVCG